MNQLSFLHLVQEPQNQGPKEEVKPKIKIPKIEPGTINCLDCGRYLKDGACVCPELLKGVEGEPYNVQLKAVCRHNENDKCSHVPCLENCVNKPEILLKYELGQKEVKEQKQNEQGYIMYEMAGKIFRRYCLICGIVDDIKHCVKKDMYLCNRHYKVYGDCKND